jgi:hypothetical protein
MSRAKNRPRRGHPTRTPGSVQALVLGGPGTYAPAGEESITEPAELPGGEEHLVNEETVQEPTEYKPLRPVDYNKEHGVPPLDWATEYDLPSTWPPGVRVTRPEPEPVVPDAVPVYVVQGQQDAKKLRRLAAYNVSVPAAGSDEPTRVCNVDPDRVEIRLLNEDSANDIRISSDLEELAVTSAQGTGSAGNGALLWHGTNSYTDIKTQDEIWAICESGTTPSRLSVLIVTEAYGAR